MRRLSVRLLVSHVLVAVIGGLATFWIAHLTAPRFFDDSVGLAQRPTGDHTPGAGGGAAQGGGNAGLGTIAKQQFADAVDKALLVGAVVGVLTAALFGVLVAWRLLRPLAAVGDATRRIAAGDYDARVPSSDVTEFDRLAVDVNALGASLADTEARRVRLLGEVAHELRTPLTVLDGYVEGMIDGVLPTGPEQLGQLTDEVRRLRRLAEDLSTLSRAEEGRLSHVAARVDVGRIVADAAGRLRPQAEDAGLTLSVAGGHGLEVDADADRLAQVVTNLVGNAIRATPSGGSVSIGVERAGGTASVRVTDTGEGLDPADLERVFERFFRVPGRRGGGADTGSGIGLTIARQIARAHGGELTASSPGRGQGATFTLTLPLAG